ncbi:MAG: protein phosphatase 2C domain-containing protein [Sulfuricella sp.]|nr:protein phosphatase 2C domain-containing protein [Sulfuricella sp.]
MNTPFKLRVLAVSLALSIQGFTLASDAPATTGEPTAIQAEKTSPTKDGQHTHQEKKMTAEDKTAVTDAAKAATPPAISKDVNKAASGAQVQTNAPVASEYQTKAEPLVATPVSGASAKPVGTVQTKVLQNPPVVKNKESQGADSKPAGESHGAKAEKPLAAEVKQALPKAANTTAKAGLNVKSGQPDNVTATANPDVPVTQAAVVAKPTGDLTTGSQPQVNAPGDRGAIPAQSSTATPAIEAAAPAITENPTSQPVGGNARAPEMTQAQAENKGAGLGSYSRRELQMFGVGGTFGAAGTLALLSALELAALHYRQRRSTFPTGKAISDMPKPASKLATEQTGRGQAQVFSTPIDTQACNAQSPANQNTAHEVVAFPPGGRRYKETSILLELAEKMAEEQYSPQEMLDELRNQKWNISPVDGAQGAVVSITGPVRKRNEDTGLLFSSLDGANVMMSFDGLGGLADGHIASKFAALALTEALCGGGTLKQPVEKRLNEAYRLLIERFREASILKFGNDAYEGFRSTAIVAVATDKYYHIVSQGDGGAFLRRADGKIEAVTIPDKGEAQNMVTASLGPISDGIPKQQCIPRLPGDILFLGSDGIVDRTNPQEVLDALHSQVEEGHSLQSVVENIVDSFAQAFDDKGYYADDNMTLVSLRTPKASVLRRNHSI